MLHNKTAEQALLLCLSWHFKFEIIFSWECWCERSEADQLENPLIFGQACFQGASQTVNQLRGDK
jgi:hypothetical protein